MAAQTLYDKIWAMHWVAEREDGIPLIYIDRHLLHEVTSPQAFAGLRQAHRKPWRVAANLATPDHNVPTTDRKNGVAGITDEISRIQVETLDANCGQFGIEEFGLLDPRQGIVHVVGPEQGATLPGMTIVCGDSHTSTHGAFAALAQGIGTSEVEHVLATQCLSQRKAKNMRILIEGQLQPGVYAKDIIMAVIAEIGTSGGTGHTIEYAGEAIRNLSMEGRMTVCNMSIEAGARAGMIGIDQTTIDYIRARPFAPKGDDWDAAIIHWRNCVSDAGAGFDLEFKFNAATMEPMVSWGTSPEMVVAVSDEVPDPDRQAEPAKSDLYRRALAYMGLKPGQKITDIKVNQVFVGSCTNARIEDLREAAMIAKGHKVSSKLERAIVVPGSGLVKRQAEAEGLHEIFLAGGFEWRDPGCSMCLAMNADKLGEGQHCASTSNRNFEGRQGYGGRTHLVSPAMAAAAAIEGRFVDVRDRMPA